MKNYRSYIDALNDLRMRGYTADFTTDTNCLYCGDLDLRLNPEEFKVDEIYRFESDTDPDNNAAIYAVSTSAGLKGTLVDGYGPDSSHLNFHNHEKFQSNLVIAD